MRRERPLTIHGSRGGPAFPSERSHAPARSESPSGRQRRSWHPRTTDGGFPGVHTAIWRAIDVMSERAVSPSLSLSHRKREQRSHFCGTLRIKGALAAQARRQKAGRSQERREGRDSVCGGSMFLQRPHGLRTHVALLSEHPDSDLQRRAVPRSQTPSSNRLS